MREGCLESEAEHSHTADTPVQQSINTQYYPTNMLPTSFLSPC